MKKVGDLHSPNRSSLSITLKETLITSTAKTPCFNPCDTAWNPQSIEDLCRILSVSFKNKQGWIPDSRSFQRMKHRIKRSVQISNKATTIWGFTPTKEADPHSFQRGKQKRWPSETSRSTMEEKEGPKQSCLPSPPLGGIYIFGTPFEILGPQNFLCNDM